MKKEAKTLCLHIWEELFIIFGSVADIFDRNFKINKNFNRQCKFLKKHFTKIKCESKYCLKIYNVFKGQRLLYVFVKK